MYRGCSRDSWRGAFKLAASICYGALIAAVMFGSTSRAQVPPTPTPTPPPVASSLKVNPATLHLGTQMVLPPNGATSPARNATVTLSRKEPSPVVIEEVLSSDPQFSVGASNCTTLAPGQRCTVSIKFTPNGSRQRRAVLTIISNASNSRATIQLAGTGKQGKLTIQPRSLSFGTVAVGSSTINAPKTVTLTNKNSVPMILNGISSGSPNVFQFPIASNTCGATLPAGGHCTLQIYFQPAQNGSIRSSVFVNDNALKSPQAIHLAGSGNNGPRPTRTPTPTATPSSTPTPAPGLAPVLQFPLRAFPAIH